MKKRTLVLISLLAIMLNGCIILRVETKIKKDGSGTNSMVIALDKSTMSMIESMAQDSGSDTGDIWAEARAGAQEIPGAKVEDYSDEDSEGIKVIFPFKNLDEFQELSTGAGFDLFESVTMSQDGDTRTLNAVLSSLSPSSDFGEGLEGFDMQDVDLQEMDIEVTYSVEVEGKILAYSPKDIAQVKGSKVTWDLVKAQSDTLELMVKWGPGGGSNMTVILLAVIAVGGVALVAIGGMLVIRDRSRGLG